MMRTYYWFIGAVVFGVMMLFVSPYYSINPGVLSKGHENLKDDCMTCHTLVQGAVTEKCIACHKQDQIGVTTATASHPARENKRALLLHKNIREIDCVVCHREHTGESKNLAVKKFSHDIINSGVREKCSACHDYQKPKDDFHASLQVECGSCHNTSNWKEAEFNHDLNGVDVKNCNRCHEKDKPKDDMHANFNAGESCSACHNTKGWKPSTFDHSKYFVFDKDHPSTCSNCHTSGQNFKTYTCYNCHEHNEAKISSKHLKEGITDFKNCVRCHRSSDKHGLEGGEGKKNEGEKKKKDHSKKERDDD
ncbi:MAG: hypothetical protein LCH52_16360 [Bacteroidetes bacterium]|nr:hypothetical protein [Bacteroidota bacterium]